MGKTTETITIEAINTDDLIDNPDNGEDIDYTADLELSIEQNGFTDPLDVTDFGCEDGKYMIVSGHRRRNAGVKAGMAEFPCIIRHFENKDDMVNCMLLSQSFRDSSKDPLLYARRYKLHEKYLTDADFKGSKREEIARRLGLSVQQADRYAAMDKIVFPVWDLVQAGAVSISAVQPMASHTEDEQLEILNIMNDAIKDGHLLTRDTMSSIVEAYRTNHKITWDKIDEDDWKDEDFEDFEGWDDEEYKDEEIPLLGSATAGVFINDEPGNAPSLDPRNRNSEMRREHDPIAAEYDKMDADKEEWEKTFAEESERDKRIKRTDALFVQLAKLKKFFDDDEDYMAKNEDDAERLFEALTEMAGTLIVEANNLTAYHEEALSEPWIKAKHNFKNIIDGCI